MTALGGESKELSRRGLAFAGVVVFVVVADQITKWLAVAHLTRAFDSLSGFGERLSAFLWSRHPVRAGEVIFVEGLWDFIYVENPGSAWGFMAGSASWFRVPFFLVVSAAAMVFIVVYFRRTEPRQKLLRLALALVFGGALGNFLDRVRLGYVIDFIDWHWYDKFTWPTFNVADSAITVGVAIMILDMLLHRAPADVRKPQEARGNS